MDQGFEVIHVPMKSVGRIIGARGSKIREIQDNSQARIQIPHDEEVDGNKPVKITGTPDQIAKAKELIEECLDYDGRGNSNRSSGFGGGGQRGRRDDRNNQWGDKRDGFGGRGGDFQENKRGQGRSDQHNWRQRNDKDYSYGRSNGSQEGWGGRQGGFQENRGGSTRFDSQNWKQNNDEDDSWGRSNGSHNSWGGRNNGTNENDTSDEWQEDNSDGYGGNRNGGRNDWGGGRRDRDSRGQGGSKIRSLQDDSGCRIKVSNDGSNGVNMVEIFGSPSQIEEAKRLVSNVVDIVDRSGTRQGQEEEPEIEIKPSVPIDWSKVYQSSQDRAKEKFKDLPPIIKDFYDEHESVTYMSREEVMLIRKENNNILVESPENDSTSFPNPVRTFEDAFHNYPLILEQIYNQNFVKPSPIQCQAWPMLLQGKDLIGIAQTGTGKTLAFLLPALIHIDNQPVPRKDRTGPSALILSPTRELAQQIEVEVNKINYKGIRSICVYGGGDRREQMKKVKQGVEIVVATPGRLNDFMMNGIIDVTNVTYLVMDEADRMLDLGFALEIKKVMMDIRPDRQTVMTSATWPDEVQHLADSYMTDPYKVFVGTLDLAAVHSVRQCVEICQDYEKKELILEFVEQMGPTDKVIIFVGKKIIADDLSSDLAMSNIVCQCIHGDREQCDREAALSEFKSSFVRILVATDVASRGLDVPDITHVINYDFPRHIEEYVHRIGRTGRAGRSGVAITFVTRGDWKSAQQLIDIMSEADQEIPDDLVRMAERYTSFKQRRDEEGFTPGMRGGRGRGRGRGGRGRRRDDDDTFFM